ncbi:MAG: NAD(P)H-binding protein [Myxococcales bacterium]|nr:NAD(P)H-binding protein [Myxococcales bacterium]
MSIVINTPNGNIGRALAEQLLNTGETLTVISRTADKVAPLIERGARLVQGSIDDAATLDQALHGARALFWLTPPVGRPDFKVWATAAGAAAAAAAEKHGVKTVVMVSSVGAQTGDGTGPVSILRSVENEFQAHVPNFVALRAGFFMENLLMNLQSIGSGTIYMPIPADVPAPMVATRDIAMMAASYLLCDGWRGHHIVGVHGPKDLTQNQVVAELSRVLGKTVRYQQVPVEAAKQAMLGFGMPEFAVNIFGEMYQAIVDGRMRSAEPRTPQTTTTTTLREFIATVIKPALAGSGTQSAS